MRPDRPAAASEDNDLLALREEVRMLREREQRLTRRVHELEQRPIAPDDSAALAAQSRIELLQAVIDAVPYLLMAKDSSHRFLLINKSLADEYHARAEDYLGRTAQELACFSDQEKAEFRASDALVLATGRRFEAQAQVYQGLDGQEQIRHVIKAPLRDAGGATIGIVGFSENVTDRKRAEEALRESEERLRNLIEGSIQGVLIHRGGKVLFANPAFCEIWGLSSADDLPGSSMAGLVPAHERERLQGYIDARMRSEPAPPRYEFEAMRKDGTPIWVESCARLVAWDGGPAIQATLIDVTERKRAERQRESLLANLRKTNRELLDFATMVSHDLKVPLRGIASLAGWLGTDHGHRLNGEGREYLRMLQVRVRRLGQLLEGIQAYSRVGRQRSSLETLDSHALLLDVVETLAPPPAIRIEISGHLPEVIYDRTQLMQVFQNLVGNAIQHLGHPAGTIAIACREDGNRWSFAVKDDGVGIESRHFERIFRLFQRLAPADEDGSMGLGLSLVKRIVESRGGAITVASQVGQGSTFTFTVPKTPVAEPEDLSAAGD